MLVLLYAAGLRISELVSFAHAECQFTVRVLRVIGKGGKERLVPVGDQAIAELTGYLEQTLLHLSRHR